MWFLDELKAFWKTYVFILTPIVLLPLPLVVPGTESRCGYAVLIMAVYWLSEAIPIAVTALLPMILFPMLGVLPASQVAPNYMRDTTFVFIGGLAMAIAVEKANLHTRVALKTLSLMGTKPRWLMLGFMIPTWFLSMWISNTATTAMMIPVVAAVLQQFKISMLIQERGKSNQPTEKPMPSHNGYVNKAMEDNTEEIEIEITHFGKDTPTISGKVSKDHVSDEMAIPNKSKDAEGGDINLPSADEEFATKESADKYLLICKMLSLSVCYSANIGGTGTLTGTSPNLLLVGFMEELWVSRGLSAPISWASWLPFALPLAFICLVICWLWMVVFFLGPRDFCCCCGTGEHDSGNEERVKKVIDDEYKKLGSMKYDEIMSLTLFGILVLLWFTRDPGFIPGYAMFFEQGYVSDSVPAMLMGLMLYVFPEQWAKSRILCGLKKGEKPESLPGLMNWNLFSVKMPWGAVFIVGGGFAMADAVENSGLSVVIADALSILGELPGWVMIFLISLLVAVLTNITSNTATTTLILPILSAMAEGLGLNPLYLCLPATISASMAFLLPVATPPNAIVFATGYLQVKDMVLAGLVLNILCILVILMATHTWGMALYNLDVPPWDMNVTMSAIK